MPDMLLPFEATLKGSPYIFMAVPHWALNPDAGSPERAARVPLKAFRA